MRGGGGNFGVVTEFVYWLHEVGPEVMAGLIAGPASEADAVLDLYRRVVESAPPELTLVVLMHNAPPASWLPPAAHGTPIILVVVCHSGGLEQATADLAPIRALGEPLRPDLGQRICRPANAPGRDAAAGDALLLEVGVRG